MGDLNCHNIADLRLAARRRLPRGLFEFVDRGTEEEVSLRHNRQTYDGLHFLPRPLVDVAGRSLETTILGERWAAPFAVAPTGLAGMLWHHGEVALARAAAAAGIPFAISTASITPLEEVAQKAAGNLWFQLYMWSRMDLSFELVERAKASGYRTLVVTVDSVVNSNREHNRRNGFTLPMRLTPRNVLDGAMHPAWTLGVMGRYVLGGGIPEFANFPRELRTNLRGNGTRAGVLVPKNESQTWHSIEALRRMWDGKLVVKGLLHPLDARRAVECGADAIVVSNHGGRTLDGAVPPILVLPAVVQEVGSRTTVLMDSSITRGSDIVKALALGAKGVLIGRATLWGTAAAGQRGAALAIDILKTEIDRIMAYLGCRSIADIGRDLIYNAPSPDVFAAR